MQNIDQLTKIKIYSVLAIFASISIIIIGWWIWSDLYCGKLVLTVAPESSLIKINGKDFKNGTHTMTPGKYKVEVSKDGFESDSKEFEIKSGQKTNVLLSIGQKDPKGDWYLKHQEDDIIRSGVTHEKITDKMKDLISKNPIVRDLPYTNTTKGSVTTGFTVSYVLNPEDKTEISKINVVIYSKCNSSNFNFYKDLAIDWMKSKQKDVLDKYTVNYLDPTCGQA